MPSRVTTASGRSHMWRSYDGADSFLQDGLRYLNEGAARDERLVYVSGRPLDQMRDDVSVLLPAAEELVDADRLTLVSYRDGYDLDPDVQVAQFGELTELAVAEGLTGVRVLAELTGLAAGPQRGPLLRYEHLADRYMAGHALSAFCVVDGSELPEETVADLDAIHPYRDSPVATSGFRLLPQDDGLALTGAVDAWEAERLRDLLTTIAGDGEVRLHLEELEFIGARGLAALARFSAHLQERGGRLSIVGAHAVVHRAGSVLGLDLPWLS